MGRLKLSRTSPAFVVPRPGRARPIRALIAAAVLGMIVMPIAFAGAASGPQATASGSVKKQVKKLRQQVNELQQQVEDLSKQPGPQGPGGPQGAQGPPGPATGPAGGDLTGTYPNPLIGPATVGSDELEDNAVIGDDLANDSVDNAKLRNDAVTSQEIANSAVSGEKIATGTIGSSDIGDDQVTELDIGPSSVGSSELLPDSVGSSELRGVTAVVSSGATVTVGTPRTELVTCPLGRQLVAGGFAWQDDEANSIIASAPSEARPYDTWVVRGMVPSGSNTLYAWATCLDT